MEVTSARYGSLLLPPSRIAQALMILPSTKGACPPFKPAQLATSVTARAANTQVPRSCCVHLTQLIAAAYVSYTHCLTPQLLGNCLESTWLLTTRHVALA
jgi:hypothetical protein